MHASIREAQTKHITLARLIPDDTPAARLRALEERYRIGCDPTVQATPPDYRQAILSRLHELIAKSPVMEQTR
jgi:hypothetical protein